MARKASGAVCAVLHLALAASVWALPGELDSTFGNGGKVLTAIGARGRARAVALQPDGKIVAAGSTGSGIALARYNVDGSPDGSFGSGGVVTPLAASNDGARAVVLQTDGRIVVTGEIGGDFALVRFNADGTADATFGVGGVVTTDFGSTADAAHALVLQPDGKLVAAGRNGNPFAGPANFALARYHADGTLDGSFGTGGKVTTDLGSIDVARALLLQGDGALVAVGSSGVAEFGTDAADFALARYTPAGTLDASFGSGGKVLTDLGGRDLAYAAALQPDGKIVAAGASGTQLAVGSWGIDPANDFAVARYEASGALDGTFGAGGLVTTTIGSFVSWATGVVVEPDGKIVAVGVSGFFSTVGNVTELPVPDETFVAARYQSDGAVDTAFAPCVQAVTAFDIRVSALGVARQLDGRLVVVGGNDGSYGDPSEFGFALARYGTSTTPVCEPAARATLKVRNDGTIFTSDHLKWRWASVGPVGGSAFGDPTSTSDQTFCLIDDALAVPRLRLFLPAVGGRLCVQGACCTPLPCWSESATGFKYKFVLRRIFGNAKDILKVSLTSGGSGKVALKAGGRPNESLGMFRHLPLTLPVTARLVRSDASACWESTFATASTSSVDQFVAKLP